MADSSTATSAAPVAAAADSSCKLEPVSTNYQACLPHLTVTTSEVDQAIDFYKKAFAADFFPRYSYKRKADQQDDGARTLTLGHFKFGSAEFLLSENEKPVQPPANVTKTFTNVVLHVLTDDVKGAVDKAKSVGAEVLQGPQTTGVRMTMLTDPFGYLWAFSDTVLVDEQQAAEEKPSVESAQVDSTTNSAATDPADE